jgi:CheY-like chemotaxis protein
MIVQKICEQMKCKFIVKSEKGKGSTFIVEIPTSKLFKGQKSPGEFEDMDYGITKQAGLIINKGSIKRSFTQKRIKFARRNSNENPYEKDQDPAHFNEYKKGSAPAQPTVRMLPIVARKSSELLSPMLKVEEDEKEAIQREDEELRKKFYQKIKEDFVLVVDDYAANRLVLAQMLERMEIKTIEAANGQEACKIVTESLEKESAKNISLILMDYDMPIMDGVQATRIIRNLESKQMLDKEIPIAAVTAFNGESEKQMCEEAGMQHFLSKPVKMTTLKGLVQKYNLINN